MNIGIVYDLFDDLPWIENDPRDADAEKEPKQTLDVIEEAIRFLGHELIRLGSPLSFGTRLPDVDVDIAINIAEAARSRNREAYAPILLEMAASEPNPFRSDGALQDGDVLTTLPEIEYPDGTVTLIDGKVSTIGAQTISG